MAILKNPIANMQCGAFSQVGRCPYCGRFTKRGLVGLGEHQCPARTCNWSFSNTETAKQIEELCIQPIQTYLCPVGMRTWFRFFGVSPFSKKVKNSLKR